MSVSLSGLEFEDKTRLRLHYSRAPDCQYEAGPSLSLGEIFEELAKLRNQDKEPVPKSELVVIAGKGYRNERPFSITQLDFQELIDQEYLDSKFVDCLYKDDGCLGYFTEQRKDKNCLTMIIRTPFSPYVNFTCNIRLDLKSERVTCVFFSQTETDITKLMEKTSCSHSTLQDTLLHCLIAVLEVYSSAVKEGQAALNAKLQAIERGTGMTSLPANFNPIRIDARYESLTREMHSCNTDLIFLSNVADFERDLVDFCQRAMKTFQSMRLGITVNERPEHERDRIFEHLLYCLCDAQGRRRQIDNMTKRIQSQINLMYSLISQRDTRATVELAEAARKDSRTMRTIALMTLIFLPGTLIMSIFSTDVFNLRAGDSQAAVDNDFVARYWWILLIVAVTFTIAVVGSWVLWERRKRKSRNRKRKRPWDV